MAKLKYCEPSMYDIVIGIDAGTHTGFAVKQKNARSYDRIATLQIHDAIFAVMNYVNDKNRILVVVEDARLATHNRGSDIHKAQGAGSIKRDAAIWEDFLSSLDIPFIMCRPDKALTKWPAALFKRQTGYTGRTSEHARDAAMMILQY